MPTFPPFSTDELADLVIEMQEARIHTLQVALRAALTVQREWLDRIQDIDGRPMINIQDEAGAKRLYRELVRALEKSTEGE